ncbi:hypothetical protein D9V34_07815 [Mycetocola lacteus]|uniref:DUF3137 domain-containing protein n=1 Tax=Mycetocola lacteus TaxID=76637 RepID=A0A3L7AUC0_9MICO|nr:hypothetical protein [Mycetocola lacteus]RLP83130.1 hypothetical protein D9V34_07815 [Mycetocola lacteus]
MSTPESSPRDFGAFEWCPTRGDRAEFSRALTAGAEGPHPLAVSRGMKRRLGILLAIPVAVVFVLTVARPVAALLRGEHDPALTLIQAGFFLTIVLGLTLVLLLLNRNTRRALTVALQLRRFARDNDLGTAPASLNPRLPGMPFTEGTGVVASDRLLAGRGQRYFELANLRFTTGTGRSARIHHWAFLAVRLSAHLPHIVLDARANNRLGTTLPLSLARDQILSLEGDFDRHFTLYCPRAYERDALQLLTPDLMALLIDHAAPFDVEIIDDYLFVYATRPLDAHILERLLDVGDTVAVPAAAQGAHYRDERSTVPAAGLVDLPGRRLRVARTWSLIAMLIVAAVLVTLMLLT